MRREVRAELHRERDVDRCGADVGDHGEVARSRRRPPCASGSAATLVQVELDGVGAGVREQARRSATQPPAVVALRLAITGTSTAALMRCQGRPRSGRRRRRIRRRRGSSPSASAKCSAAGFEGAVELELLVEDLLLEQRRQHDGGRAGVGEAPDRVEVAGERAGRGDDRGAQLEAEVAWCGDRRSSGRPPPS